MPQFKGKHYAYTPSGRAAHKRAKLADTRTSPKSTLRSPSAKRKRAFRQLKKQGLDRSVLTKGIKYAGPGMNKRIASLKEKMEDGGRGAESMPARLQQLKSAAAQYRERKQSFTPGSRYSKKKNAFVGGSTKQMKTPTTSGTTRSPSRAIHGQRRKPSRALGQRRTP